MMRMEIEDEHRALCHAAVRLYGSYDNALKAAGINPGSIGRPEPSNKKYSERSRMLLLDAARRAALLPPRARDSAFRKLRTRFGKMVQVDRQHKTDTLRQSGCDRQGEW